jgi:hypothetical protein
MVPKSLNRLRRSRPSVSGARLPTNTCDVDPQWREEFSKQTSGALEKNGEIRDTTCTSGESREVSVSKQMACDLTFVPFSVSFISRATVSRDFCKNEGNLFFSLPNGTHPGMVKLHDFGKFEKLLGSGTKL